jgi:hypothetical protein
MAHHFDTVVALEVAYARGTVIMIMNFMVRSLLICRPSLVANVTLVGPVVGGVHVLVARWLTPEASPAGTAFKYSR